MMSQPSIPKVMLLANELAPTHSVRQVIRRAGLTITLDPVSTREEFLSRFRFGSIDAILATTRGLEGLDVSEVLEQTRKSANHVPIVLIGRDAEEHLVLQNRQDGAADFVRISQLDLLPSILERLLRRQRDLKVNARVQGELDRAAEVLRENQKLITIGRLTAAIAHEINNPLEAMSNLLYLMEVDHTSPEKWEEYLRLAQRELHRVVQISKQTLTFSRETSSPMRVQLSALAEEVLVLYGRKIADKNLRVVRQFGSSELVTVFPGEVRQVLSNLIANAMEATEPGGTLMVRIRSARKWSDQGVHGIRLSVGDNGPGMSAEVRSRIGEAFFTTKGHHGTGLGLWVTRSILNRYGGHLQLRSSVAASRHGTVFSMFLPTNMRPQAVASRPSEASSPATASDDDAKSVTFPTDDAACCDTRQLASGD